MQHKLAILYTLIEHSQYYCPLIEQSSQFMQIILGTILSHEHTQVCNWTIMGIYLH